LIQKAPVRLWLSVVLILFLGTPLAAQLVPLGDEFRIVNSSSRHCPQVAMGPAGDFAVVWYRPDYISYIPFGNHFDAQGRRLETPVRLGRITDNAAITALSGGGYAVTNGREIRRFDAGVPLGRAFPLSVPSFGASFASREDGGFLIADRIFREDDDIPVTRVFDARGKLLHELRFPLNASLDAVGETGDGGFLAVFRRPFPDHNLYLRRLDSDGRLNGPEVLVARGVPEFLAVRGLRGQGGRFAVLWGDHPDDFPKNEVTGRIFTSEGAAVTPAFAVNRRRDGYQDPLAAASDTQGNTLIVWQSTREPAKDPGNVVARLFDPAGLPLGKAFPVPSQNRGTQYCADAATDGQGRWVIVWITRNNHGYQVLGRLFETAQP
jgi:hypothetical protein